MFNYQIKKINMKNQFFGHNSSSSIILLLLSILFINVSWKTNHIVQHLPSKTIRDTLVDSKISKSIAFDIYLNKFYSESNLQTSGLSLPLFQKSLIGYLNLKNKLILNKNKPIITIIDFNKESTQKRLWIIDVKNQKLLLSSLVAHGQGSGENMATQFSNIADSHQSSLGFFVTKNIYFGKHGKSLILDGMDKGLNCAAKNRSIVVHGAEYVSEEFIKQHGRLGRSYGCPAVPESLKTKIIDLIQDKTMLFINGAQIYKSKHLNRDVAYKNLEFLHKSI